MEIKYAYTIVKILYQCCYVDEMNYVLGVSVVVIMVMLLNALS